MSRTGDLGAAIVACAPLLLVGCQEKAELGDAKRTPKPPPVASADALAGLAIQVEIGGKPGPVIDQARLESVPPDFRDEERRAWKLTTLFPDVATQPGVSFAVSGSGGPEVVMRAEAPKPGDAPKPDEVAEPALLVSRRGEVVATMISPKEPFPGYHGRGGRLGRSGNPVPRIVGVRTIRILIER